MSAPRVLLWALIALLLWLVVYPNAFVAVDSFVDGGALTLRNYARFFSSPAELTALWNSVWVSLVSVLLATLIGVPLAFLFVRRDFPGRGILGALVSLPVLLPPLIGVVAFMFLFGESGFVARGVQALFGLERVPWRFDGPVAILAVHAYTMYVYVFLFTAAGLARLDTGYSEAAASLGASRFHALRRVTLPMLGPAIGGAALLVFMTAMASFSAPYVFGGGFRVLTTQVYTSRLNNESGLAAVETVILALVSLAFLFAMQRFEASRAYTGAGKGTGAAGQGARALGAARASDRPWLRTALAIVVVLLLLLPHLTVLLMSFVPAGTWTVETFPPEYSLESYRALATQPQLLRPIANSLRMATIATVANVALAFVAGWLLVRTRLRGRRLLDTLVVLPWALPGTVIAVALASTFAVNQPLAGRFLLVGTFWILPLAYFIRNIPLVTRGAIASFRQLDPSLEEAAASLGATRGTTARRVVLPLVLPGLAAGTSLAFVTALGEFVSSILLYTHSTRPISIEILSQLRAYDLGAAAAYGMLLIALMSIAFVVGFRGVSGERPRE
ncbi:MAG TPA: iron ABC transporter permease [Longimicrobiales bacterium]